ncbi:phosphonate metabolism protein/1,5-bisphosphokinase (PRPP-forming) PhnN [Methylobrevis pamukkalensis]|uniref:Ribose 1,5-bisphosphate phosphokinase PhnN n=1 Tax=Methylobrevis pamukkalensis TaxID=1439726 RepID=A0A1E3H2T2_9HYPH|nr:phosphonate metabolism protein/1,5-bisphosphokinase (PRPP-forming) PhnN [Methylobrevis pamukkalensis]ODN70622.1 Ribose 1,5-bisphosphate phosphokinase PhnN [Methylobrevis pamukkalensis]
MSREGLFVAVVGPSGAGKDTLLKGAALALAGRADIHFVRRVITREPDGLTEDHDTLSVPAFARANADGAFCLTWAAHGLHYGLPASAQAAVRRGGKVVANISRGSLGDALTAFASLAVIEITADPAILAQRIAGRGRETQAEAGLRLSRNRPFAVPPEVLQHILIDNSFSADQGVERMIDAIANLTRCEMPVTHAASPAAHIDL